MQRSFTSLIIGIVLGVVAVVLMAVYVRSSRPELSAQTLGTVVVAGADFAPGIPVRPAQLKTADR